LDIFKLFGSIFIKNDDANKAIDETADKGESAKGKLSGAFDAIGKGAVAVGKTIATGLAVGATAMAGLTTKALNLSGELEQNMGGSQAVFGEYADKMQSKAKEAFSEMGLSTSEYLATANKMGSLFQGSGFSIEESMKLSSDAMQRASDVASIMGIDVGSAMEAVAGMAKGNFTMMDNLGVAMNDTTLNAYAMSKGIEKTTSEMSNQEKTALAMEMFLERTAYATGNYKKENESLAGSLTTAKSALTNFLDGSGDVDSLVSAFSNSANVIVKNVKELAPRLISGITELVNQVVPMIPPLLEQLLPVVIEGAVSLMNGLVSALPTILNVLVSALPSVVQSICSVLPTLLPLLINGLVSLIVSLCTNFNQIIQPIIAILPDLIISLVDVLVQNLPLLIEGAVQLVVGLVSAIPQIIIPLMQSMPTILKSLVSALMTARPLLLDGWKRIWTAVKDTISKLVSAWVDNLVKLFVKLKDKSVEKFNQLKSAITAKFESIRSSVVSKVNSLKNKVVNAFTNVKTKASEIFSKVKTAITKPIESARDAVKKIIDKIKGFFSKLKLTLPKIKLPHFKITGKLSLSPPSVPKLGIEWYKKAMDGGMIMNEPTIFGFNGKTGQFMAGGEAGSETVVGTESLMTMIRQNIAQENATMMESVNSVLNRIFDLLSEYVPELGHTQMVLDTGVMVGELAPAMDTALGAVYRKRKRGV
jgi:hypothetical protein